MLDKLLDEKIKTYPDFPKKGIIYRDVLPILSYPDIFSKLIDSMSKAYIYDDCEAIIAVDARGFVFGSAIALKLKKPLILARKPNKLPGQIISREYDLEYGKNSLSLSKESINEFNKFVIVDDLIATGGTIECILKLIQSQKKNVIGLSVVIELVELKAREKFNFPTISCIQY
tara:strand:- start:4 stop:522 length:519 start_codon:yes stop_codon:yes gene_type:complete